MAIRMQTRNRRPSWDELDRQVEALVRQQFRPQAHVRADAARPREHQFSAAELELMHSLPPADLMKISDALRRGEKPDLESFARARADAETGDGLTMSVWHDPMTGLPRREFKNTGDRKVWMDRYKAPVQLQTALTNNVENTRRQHQRYLAEHPEAAL